MLVFLLTAAGIAVGGYSYYVQQKAIFQREAQEELRAIAELKASQIGAWHNERLADARIILGGPFASRAIQEVMTTSTQPAVLEDLGTWLKLRRDYYDYAGVYLLDPQGRVRIALEDPGEAVDAEDVKLALEAMRTANVAFADFHLDPNQEPRLAIAAPIVPPGQATPIAAVLLTIDPHDFLYPFLSSWPTPSRSAESMIAERQGDEVVILNDPRHLKAQALTIRWPVTRLDRIATRAVLGIGGDILAGRDYRDEPVLAAIQSVPDTPWIVIAKVDQDEVYAPLRSRAALLTVLIGALIMAAGLAVMTLWRQQTAQSYRDQLESERRRLATVRHFEYLTKHANDIILLLNAAGTVLEANERAVDCYGYSREELLGKNLRDLRTAEARGDLDRQLREVEERGGLIYESVDIRRDGTTFPVESSTRLIEIEGRKFYQAIIRDVTERKQAAQALFESRERLRLAAEAAKIGTWHWDFASNSVAMDDQGKALFGLTPQEPFTMEAFREKMVHTEDRPAVEDAINTSISQRVDYAAEYRVIRPDRSVRWILAKGRALHDASGQPVGLIGVAMDATERRESEEKIRRLNLELEQRVRERTAQLQATNEKLHWEIEEHKQLEVALRRSEEKFRGIFHSNLVPLCAWTVGGDVIEANDPFLNLVGFTRADLEMRRVRWDDLTPPEYAEADRKAVRETMETGRSAPYEKEYVRTSGERVPILIGWSLLSREYGQGVAFALDLTELRRAEEQYRQASERLTFHLEKSPLGILEWDTEFRITRWTSGAARIFGWTAEEAVGARVHELGFIHPDDALVVGEMMRDMVGGKRPRAVMAYRNRRKDGATIHCEWYNSALMDSAGRFISVLSMALDVTERVEAEEAIRRLNADLRERVMQLRATVQELEAFSYSVSHDLRAPLRAIDGYSQALVEDYSDRLDEDGRRFVERVRAGAQRMSQLIDDLLMLSRVTRGEFKIQPVDLSALGRAVAEELKKTEPGRAVEFSIADGLLARGDPRLLRVVLENLMGNAWKFTGKKELAKIELGAEVSDGRPQFYVRDNGAGFDLAYANQLFRPFHRLHDTDDFPGSGIGLATVQRIIHRHGGRIWAESANGQGATFFFTLHLTADPDKAAL